MGCSGCNCCEYYENQKNLEKVPISIMGDTLKIILSQMEKSICKIQCPIKGTGTGFFCLIPFPDKFNLLPTLITNNHILGGNDIIEGKIISFTINNDKFKYEIKIDNTRKFYTIKKYDVTFIEIKKNEIESKCFLDIDEQIFDKDFGAIFNEKSVYLIHYPNSEKAEYSTGIIKKIFIDNYNIQHLCQSQGGSSGSPIINLTNNNVIGVHKAGGKNGNNWNLGTFLKGPIEAFYKKFAEKQDIKIEQPSINYIEKQQKKDLNNKDILNIQNYSKNDKELKDKKKQEKKEENVQNNQGKQNDLIKDNNVNQNLINKEEIDEITIIYKKVDINSKSESDISFSSEENIEELEENEDEGSETSREESIKLENLLDKNEKLGQNKLFGEKFVKKNKKICKIIIGEKEYELSCYIKKEYNKNIDTLKIKLKGISKINDASYMFQGCLSLYSLPDIYKWDTSNIIDMSYMFAGCFSLSFLSDISKWNTNNVIDMTRMFDICSSLKSFPDISIWNTTNVKKIIGMFEECASINSLPDISKWNFTNITDISHIFSGCSSLSILPDLSKWKINSVTNLSYMFYMCSSLTFIPDISSWETKNVTNINYMFYECSSISELPDISKWDTSNMIDMSHLFDGCKLLSILPDLSKWKTNNVINVSYMFDGCKLLNPLPDISGWNFNNVTNMKSMFSSCELLDTLPDISKWNTINIIDMSHLFDGCTILESLPDISKWNVTNVKNMKYMFARC